MRFAALLAALGPVAAGCARSRYRVYWGDVHGHTALSDGKGTPADYFRHAREVAGLHFAVLTDHDFGHAAPWRLSDGAWAAIQDAAEASTEDGVFVGIAGYEWTSQPKYWKGYERGKPGERLFDGPPKYYNHKNVYFPARVPSIFRAKNPAYRNPTLLARAVRRSGGLIQNNHPTRGRDGRDQWDYPPALAAVIVNTEMGADTVRYHGQTFQLDTEKSVRAFLARGGRTGFVKGSDTHEGKPAARTAVLATALTRQAIFEALRQRRCYAVSGARILVRFTIDGHEMGEEVALEGAPRLALRVEGTAPIERLEIIRDGAVLLARRPRTRVVRFTHVDDTCRGQSYYYVRVTQADADADGNPSRAWSSPIWVTRRP